jgi:hypothetical protein
MSYIHLLASNLFAKKTAVPLLASYGFFLHDCQQTCPFLASLDCSWIDGIFHPFIFYIFLMWSFFFFNLFHHFILDIFLHPIFFKKIYLKSLQNVFAKNVIFNFLWLPVISNPWTCIIAVSFFSLLLSHCLVPSPFYLLTTSMRSASLFRSASIFLIIKSYGIHRKGWC